MTDLDTLVASALGWTDIITVEFAGGVQVQGVKPGTEASGYTGYKPKHVIPKYSENIKDAWGVVDHMISNGWEISQAGYGMTLKKWDFSFNDGGHEVNGPLCDTAPEAICKAFLEAVKGKVNP